MEFIISRTVGSPEIKMSIVDKEISLQCNLDDFIKLLISEIGSVTYVLTKSEFERRVLSAKDTVVDNIKKQTIPYANKIPVE